MKLLFKLAALTLALLMLAPAAALALDNEYAVYEYADAWVLITERDSDTVGSYNGTNCVSNLGNLSTYMREVYCRMEGVNIIDGGAGKTVERSDLAQMMRRMAIRAKIEYPNNVNTSRTTSVTVHGTIDNWACDGYLISDGNERNGVGFAMYHGIMDTYAGTNCGGSKERFKPLKNVTIGGLESNIDEFIGKMD